jgi:DNA recombination protein RmuC
MILDILTLFIIGIFGFFYWKDRESSKENLIRSQEALKDDLKSKQDDLQAKVDLSLTQGISGLSKLQGKIEQNLESRNEEANDLIKNMASNVLEVQEKLNNPTSAGQFGNWQLELFLEKSNLSPDHYRTEKGHQEGRPDAEIDLPGNGKIFIDAKAILQSWIQKFEEADAELKENLLKENVDNIIKTARALSHRKYDEIEVPQAGMVVMFIPIDAILIDFMDRVDKEVLLEASKGYKNTTGKRGSPIVFASPATLGGFLGMVGLLWRERNIFDDQTALITNIKGFTKNLQNAAIHLVEGSKYHVRAGNSFRKSFDNLTQTTEIVEDLSKITDTDDLKEALTVDNFAKVNRYRDLTEADIESWLIKNPELAEKIFNKEKNE